MSLRFRRRGVLDRESRLRRSCSWFVSSTICRLLQREQVMLGPTPPLRGDPPPAGEGELKSLRRLNPLLLPTHTAPRQHRLQERPGITALLPHDLLRRPRGDDFAAAVAAFGAEVD